ncbi:DUF4129 domain-containing protein [Arthrobacter sp. C9C5]|uniref:DUF4129 domain-containing protein n=1 Tax=Arthrobacter sp. C9C5 TaxID=2735267 RepID=UPI0032DF3907
MTAAPVLAAERAVAVLSARLQPEPPVLPDRDDARRWAAEELAKAPYREAEPSWLDKALAEFGRWLRSLSGDGTPGADGGYAVPLLLIIAAVIIAVAVLVVRPRLNARRPAAKDVFDADAALSPDAHRERASAAAARGDWSAAVVEQFRALVRAAEERTVLDPQPGRTASEVAARLGRAFGAYARELEEAALTFDAARYGGADAGSPDHAALVRLDAALAGTTPDYRGTGSDALVRPL